ncbi:MAG: hypothetical protein NVS1B11_36440 [Terriglobales bacterium]
MFMADKIKVDKKKFDALLQKVLNTPPLPQSEVQANLKPKKQQR